MNNLLPNNIILNNLTLYYNNVIEEMGTRYTGSRADRQILDTWIKLSRCVQSIYSYTNKKLAENNLTVSQFSVMESLLHHGELYQSELADKLLVTPGNLVMVIDNLEKLKYVTRIKSKSDRRKYIIHLTATGKVKIINVFNAHLKDLRIVFSVLNRGEMTNLEKTCRKLGLDTESLIKKEK